MFVANHDQRKKGPASNLRNVEICTGNGYGNEVAPVDGYAGTLGGGGFVLVLFNPFAKSDIPKRERLQRRGFAGIVLADENNCLPQLNIRVGETLEVFDS